MEIKKLKDVCISNLVLIILNEKNDHTLRKCAEVELTKRIKNTGIHFMDLLHSEDKVVQERGFDINKYLISPKVNMQQLIETYFKYGKTNSLLFSENHLCNSTDFGDSFFTKVCTKEIKSLDTRIRQSEKKEQKEILLSFKQLLEERNNAFKQVKQELLRECPVELLSCNDAMSKMIELGTYHEFLHNCSDEETYKILCSKLGEYKFLICNFLNDSIYDTDLLQNLCGLMFIRKDSSKLTAQKKRLLQQLRSGFEVDYESYQLTKIMQK